MLHRQGLKKAFIEWDENNKAFLIGQGQPIASLYVYGLRCVLGPITFCLLQLVFWFVKLCWWHHQESENLSGLADVADLEVLVLMMTKFAGDAAYREIGVKGDEMVKQAEFVEKSDSVAILLHSGWSGKCAAQYIGIRVSPSLLIVAISILSDESSFILSHKHILMNSQVCHGVSCVRIWSFRIVHYCHAEQFDG